MRALPVLFLALALASCGRDDTTEDGRASGRTTRAITRAIGDAFMPRRLLRRRSPVAMADLHVLRADPDHDLRVLERSVDRLCECPDDACRTDRPRAYDLDRRIFDDVAQAHPAIVRSLDERAAHCAR